MMGLMHSRTVGRTIAINGYHVKTDMAIAGGGRSGYCISP